MITITGANGHLGRAVVTHVLELLPADQISVSVRDPQQAVEFAMQGVQVRRGDFADPSSLPAAFAGAQRLLLISTDVIGPGRIALHRNAIEAARQAGVEHILYTSITDPDPASPFGAAADHAATEAFIRESGLRYTFLRNGLYMETLLMFAGAALESGRLEAPVDAPVAYVTRDDLAAATANLLVRGGHVDTALELTGAEALDFAQVATLLEPIGGRPIERRELSDAVYRAGLIAEGLPPQAADVFLSIFAAIRQGRFTPVHRDLETLLGRQPRRAAAFLQDALLAARPA